jgi:putative proteasome-type protease
MTYCVGILVNGGLVLASDSRTHAGVDNFATFCKMTVFERPGDRVIVLLSSGNLAGTQAVISVLQQQSEAIGASSGLTLWTARTMFDVTVLVADAVRAIERRDKAYVERGDAAFNASFIIGGQINGERPRLFRTFAEGNFIESGDNTPFFQTGEAKYGKPIIDRVIESSTTLSDTVKCVLVSFDSTMKSNLSVGMPIDLVYIVRDQYRIGGRHRFEENDAYFAALRRAWGEGVRRVFRELPWSPVFNYEAAEYDAAEYDAESKNPASVASRDVPK